MRILVTNDDGIHAPGLKVMESIARALSDDVWVVAPSEEQSGAGHSLTLSRPVRVSMSAKEFGPATEFGRQRGLSRAFLRDVPRGRSV